MAYKWRATLVVALGLFMAILDNTIVNVALPQMITALHSSLTTIQWVITGYFLAQAAVIPITGYISDRVGSKLIFGTALAIFTLGSGLCALTIPIQSVVSFVQPDQLLIGFRVLQGIGGGALFPTAFAIIFRIFPPAERGPASAVIGVPLLLAPAFGPTIGGYLTQTFEWSAIFTVNVPIGIVALILVLLVLHGKATERAEAQRALTPDSGATAPAAPTAEPVRGRFDVVGLILSMVGFTVLVYGISEAGVYGWNWTPFNHFALGSYSIDMSVFSYLIAGGAILVVFILNELLVRDPVMDMRLFLDYTFTSANVLTWAVSALLFGSITLLPLFFESIQGLGPLDVGEILISQGLAAAVATVIAGQLYNRVGPRWLIAVGFLCITVGSYGFTQLTADTIGASVQVWLVLRGLGLGLTNVPLQTLALSKVSNRAMARASSLVNVTRQVFGAVGIAALLAYLTQQTTTYVNTAKATFQSSQLPAVQASCAQQFGSNAAAIGQCVQQHAQAYVLAQVPQAYNDTFFLTMVGCAVCVVLSLLVGNDPSIKATKEARKRGEVVPEPRPVMVAE